MTLINTVQAMELVHVQNVSTSGKTFVIQLGRSEGISIGQKAIFMTDNINLKATVVEATRYFSMWRLDAPSATVPFQKRQYVVMNSNSDNIWRQILDKEKNLSALTKEHQLQQHIQRHPLLSPYAASWNFKFALSHAFFETISSIEASEDENRNGMQFEMTFAKKLNYHFEIDGGLRYDREAVTQNNPKLTIPTVRYILVFDLTYHFPLFSESSSNLYASLGTGYGLSHTNVANNVITKGPTIIIPIIRLGYIKNMSRNYSFLIESSFEAVNTTETFSDSTPQDTSIVNGKISAGLRF